MKPNIKIAFSSHGDGFVRMRVGRIIPITKMAVFQQRKCSRLPDHQLRRGLFDGKISLYFILSVWIGKRRTVLSVAGAPYLRKLCVCRSVFVLTAAIKSILIATVRRSDMGIGVSAFSRRSISPPPERGMLQFSRMLIRYQLTGSVGDLQSSFFIQRDTDRITDTEFE